MRDSDRPGAPPRRPLPTRSLPSTQLPSAQLPASLPAGQLPAATPSASPPALPRKSLTPSAATGSIAAPSAVTKAATKTPPAFDLPVRPPSRRPAARETLRIEREEAQAPLVPSLHEASADDLHTEPSVALPPPRPPTRAALPPPKSVDPLELRTTKPVLAKPDAKPTKPEPTKPEPKVEAKPEPKLTKPEPTKPEPTKPEPTKPEPTKPEPTRPEPTKVEAKPEPTKPEPAKPEPTRPEPTKVEAKAEPAKPEPTKPELTKPEPTKPELTKPEPKLDAAKLDPMRPSVLPTAPPRVGTLAASVTPARAFSPPSIPPASSPPGFASSSYGSVPPASSPGFLIPRPSSPGSIPAPAVTTSAGSTLADGDALRERVAQLEVTASAARSIAQRASEKLDEALRRSHEHAPRLAELERLVADLTERHASELASLRASHAAELERAAALHAEALASHARAHEAELAVLRARVERPVELAHVEARLDTLAGQVEPLRTSLSALRVEVDAHSRAFDARRIRIDAIEHELTSLKGGAHLAELRRGLERLDLRIAGLEQSLATRAPAPSAPASSAPALDVAALRAELAESLRAELFATLRDGLRSELAADVRAEAARADVERDARSYELTPSPSAALALPLDGEASLVRIKGVGPKTAKTLVDAGVRGLADVAAWSDADLARIAELLGKKPAQLAKQRWPELARELLADA